MTQLPAPAEPASGGGPASPGATTAVAAAPPLPVGTLAKLSLKAPAPPTAPVRWPKPASAPTGIAALLRLAVVSVDTEGRVAHWNRGAEELFGHRWEAVFGHSATGLLSTPTPGRDGRQNDVFGLLDGLTVASWAGEFPITGRDDMHRQVMLWSYRIDESPGRGLLVLAANATSLRSGALRIAIGDRMLPYALVGAAGPDGIRVLPRLGPPADPQTPVAARLPGADRINHVLAERLRTVLPRVGRGRLEQLMRLVRRLGYPAVEVEGAAPLPVLPYEAFEPYGPAEPVSGATTAPRPEPVLPVAVPRQELPPGTDQPPTPPENATPGTPGTPDAGTANAPGAEAPGTPHTPGPEAPGHPADAQQTAPDAAPLTAQATAPHTAQATAPDSTQDAPADSGTAQEVLTGTVTGSGEEGAACAAPGSVPVPPGGIGPAARSGYAGSEAGEPDYAEYASHSSAVPGHLVNQQLDLLRETGTRVGTTLSLETTAAELCRVAVPRFADFATVLIVDDVFSGAAADALFDGGGLTGTPVPGDGLAPGSGLTVGAGVTNGNGLTPGNGGRPARLTVRRLAVANRLPNSPWDRVLPEGELFTLAAGRSPGLTEPLLLPTVDAALADDLAADLGVPGLGQLLPGRSLLITPLTARGLVLGRMCFVREPLRRPFTTKDVATAVEVAARGALHLDNARLHQFEARAATTLQRSMLPAAPPPMPGVRVAHHYRPGDRQAQVGGDWFDAIQLPGGRVALIVGDVMGHGLLSAAVMGQFRTAVQTMAALDLPPAQLLRHLDNLAHKLGPDHLATCVYAVYDPIHRTLTLANAGHIPPVLARPDGRSELLRIPEGAPIGVGGIPFETVEIEVPDGSWLVLCTDGLVEVRGQGIDAGLAALCANVIEPEHTPEDVCGQILSRVHYEERTDDVALLVARFDGIDRRDVAEWRLDISDAEVRVARAHTRRQLAEWGLEQLTDLAELLVSELVTNALRVASQEVTLRLMRVGALLVEVSDDDHNLPQLRRADQDDEHGRGLALVSNLSRRWGTSRQAVGKVVWFELPLPKG
ncbi:SpoIIE family protein phosphatase [Streptantibioticus silvisoli]|uniref:SpoIIE family protein phosphatase n=1 Tax=Streptantibioticus silvisoli TaxID=2705255 RepID=A0ABT6W0N1_9ACTN|nr:SpoIIE family protein phosphatase [Streptantibioticus silvisoli]MDI5964304.1 SpoIIE family protein phosphatase [Streptantibioticus silvisoli]